ncbi:MAG TPA: hypothetical protein VNF48_06135 [Gammaproteobacteria bacterium]|nr:hypothetical protein [Gammaproteobacteria bacterium]
MNPWKTSLARRRERRAVVAGLAAVFLAIGDLDIALAAGFFAALDLEGLLTAFFLAGIENS